MNYFTNNIKTATGYQRDSSVRTASEKLLDKHFYQADKNKLIQNVSKQFQQPEPRKKTKQETHSNQEELLSQTPQQIVSRIMKHFESPNKITKSLEVLFKFVSSPENGFRSLDPEFQLQVLFRLVQLCFRKQYPIQRKAHTQIYNLFAAVQKMEPFKDKKDHNEVFEIFRIVGINHSGLHTDDSFEFNKHIAELTKVIESFEFDTQKAVKYQADKAQLKKESTQELTHQLNVEQHIRGMLASQDERISQKRETIHRVIKSIMHLGRVTWAKVSIDHFLKKFNNNYRQQILTESQDPEFKKCYEQYQNKRIQGQLKADKQESIDRMIMKNPANSMHRVKDARVETFSGDGSDRWSQKQM